MFFCQLSYNQYKLDSLLVNILNSKMCSLLEAGLQFIVTDANLYEFWSNDNISVQHRRFKNSDSEVRNFVDVPKFLSDSEINDQQITLNKEH